MTSRLTLKEIKATKYGRLVVVREVKPHICPKSDRGHRKFNCVCNCGNKVDVLLSHLRNGNIKSCGCLLKERMSTNGKYETRIYKIYKGMIKRC